VKPIVESYIEPKWTKGWITPPDTTWIVETTKDNDFVYVGEVFVSGAEVSKQMNEHHSIKGYMPYNLAKRKAHKKYPEANPIIIHLKELPESKFLKS